MMWDFAILSAASLCHAVELATLIGADIVWHIFELNVMPFTVVTMIASPISQVVLAYTSFHYRLHSHLFLLSFLLRTFINSMARQRNLLFSQLTLQLYIWVFSRWVYNIWWVAFNFCSGRLFIYLDGIFEVVRDGHYHLYAAGPVFTLAFSYVLLSHEFSDGSPIWYIFKFQQLNFNIFLS